MLASPAAAQATDQSEACETTSPPQLTATVSSGDTFAVAFCGEQSFFAEYDLFDNGVRDGRLAARFIRDRAAASNGRFFYRTNLIDLPVGSHALQVRLVTDGGTVLTEMKPPLVVTVMPSAAPDACAGKYPSVFVTRLIESGTGRPGARMMVLYQFASVTPVVKVEVLVDGAVVATKTATGSGDSLTDDAAMWFSTPASGRHDLAVRATNGDDCQRSGTLLTPFIVK